MQRVQLQCYLGAFCWLCRCRVSSRSGSSEQYSFNKMTTMASQIIGVSIVYSTACSGADQGKQHRSASLACVREIDRWPVNFPYKGPVTRKMFPFDDVIMLTVESHNHMGMGGGGVGGWWCRGVSGGGGGGVGGGGGGGGMYPPVPCFHDFIVCCSSQPCAGLLITGLRFPGKEGQHAIVVGFLNHLDINKVYIPIRILSMILLSNSAIRWYVIDTILWNKLHPGIFTILHISVQQNEGAWNWQMICILIHFFL